MLYWQGTHEANGKQIANGCILLSDATGKKWTKISGPTRIRDKSEAIDLKYPLIRLKEDRDSVDWSLYDLNDFGDKTAEGCPKPAGATEYTEVGPTDNPSWFEGVKLEEFSFAEIMGFDPENNPPYLGKYVFDITLRGSYFDLTGGSNLLI